MCRVNQFITLRSESYNWLLIGFEHESNNVMLTLSLVSLSLVFHAQYQHATHQTVLINSLRLIRNW